RRTRGRRARTRADRNDLSYRDARAGIARPPSTGRPLYDLRSRERVGSPRAARLATTTPAGRPHVVPVCFVLVGDTVYSAVDGMPKSTRQLQRLANQRAH